MLLTVLWVLLTTRQALAQEAINYKNALTLKFFGFTMHLKESPYPEIFPNKLDEKGYATMNYGGIVGYDRYLKSKKFSIRAEQGLYTDCAGKLAGFSHLGFRVLLIEHGRHALNAGLGPTLVYRKDWNRLDGYLDDGYFKRKGDWQYRFYWYGAEMEYNYLLNNSTSISVNLVPGLPELISFGAGVRKHF